MKIDRRAFLKQAGLGSAALAALPAFVDMFSAPAQAAAGEMETIFASVSAAGPPGTPASPRNHIVMGGDVKYNPRQPASEVRGGGFYVHYLFPGRNPLPGEPTLSIVAAGTWKARLLVSSHQIGSFGVLAAGTVEFVVDLLREVPSPAVIRGAKLKITCNLGPAALSTGEPEGYFLSIPATEFSAGGTFGPFAPLAPVVGTNLISTVALS